MEFAQTLLTYTAQFIALAGFGGITLHAIWSQHRRFMTTYCPPVTIYTPESREVESVAPSDIQETFPEADVVATVTEQLAEVMQATDEALAAVEAVATRKLSGKKQLTSVGAAAVDYNKMNVQQLRKECSLQNVNWRSGGDYGRPMRKNQMIRALG